MAKPVSLAKQSPAVRRSTQATRSRIPQKVPDLDLKRDHGAADAIGHLGISRHFECVRFSKRVDPAVGATAPSMSIPRQCCR
jgi:hypothetical protein